MAEAQIDYPKLVERALRQVVRETLTLVAQQGLPGDHHLYLTFRTNYPGVELPDALRLRYPNEMTIVLQFEFWGLEVDHEQFGVTLSFANVPHRLVVPFAAITVFADPSVEFGLQFSQFEDAAGRGAAPASRLRSATGEAAAPNAPDDGAPDQGDGAEVVTLDQFRKK